MQAHRELIAHRFGQRHGAPPDSRRGPAGQRDAGQGARHDRAHRGHADRGADAARELIERRGEAEPRPIDAVLHGQQQRQHLRAHARAEHRAAGQQQRPRRVGVEQRRGR